MKILLVLLSILMVNPLFSQSDLPDIELTKLTDIIYEMYVNNYVSLFAFTGSDGVLLIDSGFEETGKQVRAKLRELGNDKIKYIINTHSDGDHAGGNAVLGKGATIIAHERCQEKLSKKATFPREGLPTITIEDTIRLNFNSENLKLIALSGGHSVEDIIVYFPKANLVCVGDIIISDSFPFVRVREGASIQQLIQNIDKMIEMFPKDIKLVVSHGRECTINDLKKYKDMLVKTTKIVSDGLRAGKTAEEMKKECVLKNWESWNNQRHSWINVDFWIDTICEE
jgi:cyclase